MRKTDFEFLLRLLQRNVGWSFSEREYFSIDKKISNFIREKGYPTVEDLIAELKTGQKSLVWQVIEMLAFSDTRFYRDYNVFSQFQNYILPLVREANRNIKKLRILSLGCSTGQEVYSVAIAVNSVAGFSDWQVNIIGTDVSSYAISKAQKGVYNQFEIQTGLKAETMIDNFTLEGENWRVNDNIKKMTEFRRYNLLDELTFQENFDIIFCRNVLRFFIPEIQEKLCAKINDMQVPGGILYIGRGENINGMEDYYSSIPGVSCALQAKVVESRRVAQPEIAMNHMAELEIERIVVNAAPAEVVNNVPHFVRPENLSRHPLMSDALRK